MKKRDDESFDEYLSRLDCVLHEVDTPWWWYILDHFRTAKKTNTPTYVKCLFYGKCSVDLYANTLDDLDTFLPSIGAKPRGNDAVYLEFCDCDGNRVHRQKDLIDLNEEWLYSSAERFVNKNHEFFVNLGLMRRNYTGYFLCTIDNEGVIQASEWLDVPGSILNDQEFILPHDGLFRESIVKYTVMTYFKVQDQNGQHLFNCRYPVQVDSDGCQQGECNTFVPLDDGDSDLVDDLPF